MKRICLTSIAFGFVYFPVFLFPSCAQTKPIYYHVGDTWEFTMNESQTFRVRYEKCSLRGYTLEIERQSEEEIPYLYLLDLGAFSLNFKEKYWKSERNGVIAFSSLAIAWSRMRRRPFDWIALSKKAAETIAILLN
ncbi:MAG: hypothetical protein ACI32C_05740 [Candidatus Enteromonas sp.]